MKYKTFVLSYIFIVCALILLVVMVLFYLSRIFEHNSFETIVKRQTEQNSIYGTALNENVFGYKLELIKQRKPEVIALGSSRVGQIREEFFTTSFVTASNAMNTLKEGKYFLQKVLEFYKPKLVLIGLDPWFFNPSIQNYKIAEYQQIAGTNINMPKIKSILHLIYKKQFFKPKYIFDNHFISNPYTSLDSLGLNAIYKGRGFLKDGSYLYSEVFIDKPTQDAGFQDTTHRIENNLAQFVYASHIDKSRIEDLLSMLKILTDHHIEFVIFITPMAPQIYTLMKSKQEKYAYIEELFIALQKAHIKFYNYFDPTPLSRNNCEFLDGFHGGDVFYARMFYDMAQKHTLLKSYSNLSYLSDIITTHKGRVFSKDSISFFPEKDFLRLGCKK
ncbi:hypothetical protein BBW65_07690 [Helicobacter enhydrae]|uniref:Uncharacterized protein n=1 Tax=Helicobacter enhydrae TaxID=222136 RepID=A0A1B1U7N2_9HELI|nr:hypothetical protein [Helicobacter enhydrae]ANV97315.1 hypothetical protein BBW65_00075 [Helicobacter enhydrae]ANV98685.1 hypothetical protein BBW65_07690 [Helicobacter enhydrae]